MFSYFQPRRQSFRSWRLTFTADYGTFIECDYASYPVSRKRANGKANLKMNKEWFVYVVFLGVDCLDRLGGSRSFL